VSAQPTAADEQRPPPTGGRPWLRLLVSVLLMVVFVGALLTQVRLEDLRRVVRELRPGWALLSLLAYALLPLFRGWRLAALLNRWPPVGAVSTATGEAHANDNGVADKSAPTTAAPVRAVSTATGSQGSGIRGQGTHNGNGVADKSAPTGMNDAHQPRIPFWRLVFLSAVQNYLIFLLPFRAGEVSFIVLLTREKTVSASLATKALVAVRVLDGIFTLGAFLFVAALPGVCPAEARALILPVGAVLVLMIGLLLWPDRVGRWAWRIFGPVVGKLEQWRLPGAAKVRGYLEKTTAIVDVRSFRAALPSALLATLAVLLLVIVRFWCSLNAVGADISLLSTVYVATAMTVFSSLPIHGLAGFGPGDAAGAGLLMTISEPAHPTGFEAGPAIALQLGSHVLIALTTTIVGSIGSLGLQRMNGGDQRDGGERG
jgi:hypothetical protein